MKNLLGAARFLGVLGLFVSGNALAVSGAPQNTTARLTLSCSATIHDVTGTSTPILNSTFPVSYDAGSGPGDGLPGAHYSNSTDPATFVTTAPFQVSSNCPVSVTATDGTGTFTWNTTNLTQPSPLPTISGAVIGLDSNDFGTNAANPKTEVATNEDLGLTPTTHYIYVGVTLAASTSGNQLQAGSYDMPITLTLGAP